MIDFKEILRFVTMLLGLAAYFYLILGYGMEFLLKISSVYSENFTYFIVIITITAGLVLSFIIFDWIGDKLVKGITWMWYHIREYGNGEIISVGRENGHKTKD